ncbi:MAG: DUF309 domain-containing protein [Candidatus Acidiferrales bacterium]
MSANQIEMHLSEDLWQRGIEQFNRREFFECHESWEAVWLPAPEPDKTFLQGIIQVAAAFHHYMCGNRAGAESLMRRGLAKIARFPADYRGLRLADLRGSVRRWHQALAAGSGLPLRELPRIEPCSGGSRSDAAR